jgi:hypothetical protein
MFSILIPVMTSSMPIWYYHIYFMAAALVVCLFCASWLCKARTDAFHSAYEMAQRAVPER